MLNTLKKRPEIVFGFLITIAYCAVFLIIGERSFWIDEAMLALAVKETPIDRLQPLAWYEQATPLAHYFLSKALISAFGDSDFWLRLPSSLIFLAAIYFSLIGITDKYQKIATIFLVFMSPDIFRYSTEYKHYIFEFAFSLIIVISWQAINKRTYFWIYAACILLSIIATYSVVFVVLSIFLTEFMRNRNMTRRFVFNWSILHIIYGTLFLALYFNYIRPSIFYQLQNWPEIYSVGLLSVHWNDYVLWLRPVALSIHLMGGKLFFLFLMLLIAVATYVFKAKLNHVSYRSKSLFLLFATLIVIIYAVSLAGFYSLQQKRHFLFAVPIFILCIASLLNDVVKLKRKAFWAMCGVAFALGILFHSQYQYSFQETRNIVRRSAHAIDIVFAGAQPAFFWYGGVYGVHSGRIGDINPKTAVRLTAGASVDEMERTLEIPGAWSWLWSLRNRGEFSVYIDWLVKTVSERKSTNILFAHYTFGGEYLAEFESKLPIRCKLSVLDKDVNALVFHVECM